MELQDYARILARYWRSVLATVFVVLLLVAAFTWLQRPQYTASSSLFVAVDSGANAGELSQGATYSERQVKSYVEVGTTAAVLQPVITELGLNTTVEEFAEQIEITTPNATSVIRVSVTDGAAVRSAKMSNAVASSLVTTISKLAPPGPTGEGLVKATLVNPAVIPDSPSSPKPLLNLAVAVALGALLGVGQALLRHTLDTRVRSVEDIELLTDTPVLAAIGNIGEQHRNAYGATYGGTGQDEAWRHLRTSLGFLRLGGERRSSLVISSSLPGEGKTETACQLAKVLAAAGESVLLIDADLRRPQVAERLSFDGEIGLSDVLSGQLETSEALVSDGSLDVLAAGSIPPNPSELLASKAMMTLLTWAEQQYQYVLIDSPPLLPVTDAAVLSKLVGGTLVVARHGKVRKQELAAAISLLEVNETQAAGIVFNDVPRKAHARYQSGSYYYSPTTKTELNGHTNGSAPVLTSRFEQRPMVTTNEVEAEKLPIRSP